MVRGYDEDDRRRLLLPLCGSLYGFVEGHAVVKAEEDPHTGIEYRSRTLFMAGRERLWRFSARVP